MRAWELPLALASIPPGLPCTSGSRHLSTAPPTSRPWHNTCAGPDGNHMHGRRAIPNVHAVESSGEETAWRQRKLGVWIQIELCEFVAVDLDAHPAADFGRRSRRHFRITTSGHRGHGGHGSDGERALIKWLAEARQLVAERLRLPILPCNDLLTLEVSLRLRRPEHLEATTHVLRDRYVKLTGVRARKHVCDAVALRRHHRTAPRPASNACEG